MRFALDLASLASISYFPSLSYTFQFASSIDPPCVPPYQKDGVLQARERQATAVRHHALALWRLVFYPWSDWTHVRAKGLDRKQWRGPRRYEVPYNRRRVDTWARHRILRKVWAESGQSG